MEALQLCCHTSQLVLVPRPLSTSRRRHIGKLLPSIPHEDCKISVDGTWKDLNSTKSLRKERFSKKPAAFFGEPASSDDGPQNGRAISNNSDVTYWDDGENGSSYTGRMSKRDYGGGLSTGGSEMEKDLVQQLHVAARLFQDAMEGQETLTQGPWFAQKWLGIDKNAWMKSLGYQGAVHALLRALVEIADRGDGRDRDVHTLLLRSLVRQCAPLEESIRSALLLRDPGAEAWFWSDPHEETVAALLTLLETDQRFTAVTATGWQQKPAPPSKQRDEKLLELALYALGAVTRLGPSAISCPAYTSVLPDETGRILSLLVTWVPIERVWTHASAAGLRREFLDHFAARAAGRGPAGFGQSVGEGKGANGATCTDAMVAERIFWVTLIQAQLRTALEREGVGSEISMRENAEVLETDLALFGFFSFLGRSTRAYLSAKGVSKITDDAVASLLRYLEGGSVLFYPELTNLPLYQLFVEVVCEEIQWLSLYPESASPEEDEGHGHDDKRRVATSIERDEALRGAVDTCAFWVEEFLEYSPSLQDRPSSRAAKFLHLSNKRLSECIGTQLEEQGGQALGMREGFEATEKLRGSAAEYGAQRGFGESDGESDEDESREQLQTERAGLKQMEYQLSKFDKELKNVEAAVEKLDNLVREYEAGSNGRRRATAARGDLENIRRLKAEAEALEASLKAKAVLRQQRMLQVEAEQREQRELRRKQRRQKRVQEQDAASTSGYPARLGRVVGQKLGNWLGIRGEANQRSEADIRETSFPLPMNASSSTNTATYVTPDAVGGSAKDARAFEEATVAAMEEASMSMLDSEAERFQTLRGELDLLESRLRQNPPSASPSEERGSEAPIQAYREVFNQSIGKLQDSASDAWRGTQLLSADVGAAMVLLKRSVEGQELTQREKKTLKRTLTDLASVIPIGILMLLPVTAVGHAAILAFIQKYVPALIPSAYTPQRLDVAKRLQQVQGIKPEPINDDSEISSDEAENARQNLDRKLTRVSAQRRMS